MPKRPFTPLLILAVAVVVGVALKTLLYREPTFHGKPVSVWAAQLNSPDAQVRDEATAALRQLGRQAVPVLLNQLRKSDRWPKLGGSGLASKLGIRVPSWLRKSIAQR